MKTLTILLAIIAGLSRCALAQVEQSARSVSAVLTEAGTPRTSGVVAKAPELGSEYAVVERGANHRVWQRIEWEPTRSGRNVAHLHSYTELATGLHYRKEGRWVESCEEIQIVENGAVATNGPHKAAFAVNINSPVSVEVATPDHKRLRIRPAALVYYDFDADKQAVIGELKDSDGLLVGTNQVIYPDAFAGTRADVRYTYTKSGFEQDVILREKPPLPEAYGLNPMTTWLLILTEFINPPSEMQVDRQVRRGWKQSTVDRFTDFGAMKLVPGTAFSLTSDDNPRKGVPIQKHWKVLDGRTFLIEEVSFPRIAPRMRDLGAGLRSESKSGALQAKCVPAWQLNLVARPAANASLHREIQVATIDPDADGLVMDFDLESGDDVVLRGDMTYVVTDTVNLQNVVIEGGTVVKYHRSACLNLYGTVECRTGPYSPAVFTGVDDNTVGETVGGSTGNPTGWYANCALAVWDQADLKYLNVRYAYGGIYFANGNFTLDHSQLGPAYLGLLYVGAWFTNCNLLMQRVEVPFDLDYAHGRVEHLTCDQARVLTADQYFTYQWWCEPTPSSSSLLLVNSLTTAITNGYGDVPVTTDHVRNFISNAGLFQRVVGGSYYLSNDSTNRNAGTTSLQPALSEALPNLTTYPPLLYSNTTFSVDTTLGPQAQRDSDAPDLGYHYTPLDYVFGGATAEANLTFAPGTAVGWFRTTQGWYHAGHGIHAADNTAISFNGTLEQPDYWVRCNTVQEQASPAGYGPGGISAWTWPNSAAVPQVIARFTRCSLMSAEPGNFFRDDAGILRVQARDCEFWHGGVAGYNTLFSMTNCLFERTSMWLMTSESFPYMVMRNCTMHQGGLMFGHWEEGAEHFYTSIRDTVFDGTSIDSGYPDDPGCVDYYSNAYIDGEPRLNPEDDSDYLVTGSFNWQSGWLGDYYLPYDSPLIDAGSTTADAVGLYQYTTQTTQDKEAGSAVDIGLHYVAVDGNGHPVDSDWDGTPDYLEDLNGNGSVDSGETDWQSGTDPGLKVWITEPRRTGGLP